MQEQKINLTKNLLGIRLDKVLTILIPDLSLRSARRLCENGQVFSEYKNTIIQQNSAFKAKTLCNLIINPSAGFKDYVQLDNSDFLNTETKAYLVEHNADFALVYKPAFLHSAKIANIANPNLEEQLPELLAELLSDKDNQEHQFIQMLSRLDFVTSGLIPIALNAKAEEDWKNAQDLGLITKNYLAIVQGHAQDATLDFVLDTDNRQKVLVTKNKESETKRHTLIKKIKDLSANDLSFVNFGTDNNSELSLVQATIYKGVRHQIRASLAHVASPLLYDALYADEKNEHKSECKTQERFYLQHFEVISPFFSVRHFADWTKNFVEYF